MLYPLSYERPAAIVVHGDLSANAASFARHLRAANLTPATQRAYIDALTLLAPFLTEASMPTDVPPSPASTSRPSSPISWRAWRLARLAPASAANRYSSLRPFFNWLVEEGEIKASPMARMRTAEGARARAADPDRRPR